MKIKQHVMRMSRELKAQYHGSKLDVPEPACEMIDRVLHQKLTYLPRPRLLLLASLVLELESAKAEGVILEAGCALGGSGILMASVKSPSRAMQVYDVFGQIPPPTDEDGEDTKERYQLIDSGKAKGLSGDTYYGYLDNLYEKVAASYAELGFPPEDHQVKLIKGLVQDTLVVNGPVGLAHIDVDWYDPVMTCLERIEPYLIAGGSIVLDDYYEWSGCRKAVDEYFEGRSGSFTFNAKYGSLVITKKGEVC